MGLYEMSHKPKRNCVTPHQPGRVRLMSRRTPTTVLFRMVLLTLLALGLCLQPTFAATCAIDDARSTLADDTGAADIAADADSSASGDDCCPNPVCTDCCLHAVGSLPNTRLSVASVMPMLHDSQRVDEFHPRHYPVDIRPPIAR